MTDENGKPVPGAIVIILGKAIGCNADSAGTFLLERVPVGTFILKAIHITAGRSEKAGVQVTSGKTTVVDFVLSRSAGMPPDAKAPVFTGAYHPCDDLKEGDLDRQSLVQVGVRSEKRAGTHTYSYKVVNRSRDTLTTIRIGYYGGLCELTGARPHVVPDTALAPPGWICTPVQAEDSTMFALLWEVAPGVGGHGILPNSSSSGFTVRLPKRDPLYANCHWLTVTGDRLKAYRGKLRPGREVDAISMATGTIAGKVMDQSGATISGASVQVWRSGLSTTSAPDGSYTLSAVPVGEYMLIAQTAGYKRCGKGEVRVVASKTSRVDFHLSSEVLSIPCSAYTTRRDRLETAFPRDAVDTRGARLLNRAIAIPPRLPGEAPSPHPYIYSLTNRDVELVYRGLGQDTASHAFVASVRREFRNPVEERLLRIAEETYPPTKAVVSIADDRLDRKALLKEKRLWWYGEFDGVRLPYAVTMDAVRYYLELTQALGRGDSLQTHGIRMKRSNFSYTANISPGPKSFSRDGRVFEDVWVVEMNLAWSNYCGSTCACGFNLDRTVLLRRDGTVLCVFGDRKPMVVVS